MSAPALTEPATRVAEARRARRGRAAGWWAGVLVASLLGWMLVTWPLALHVGTSFWNPLGVHAGRFSAADPQQTLFIEHTVSANFAHLRDPYLDAQEGAAGPTALRTSSLDLPWSPVVGIAGAFGGLVLGYNLTLLGSSLAAAAAAFGLLRRHTRWPLLAAAGAVLYPLVPERQVQLATHFNAVMWWAVPAALWAFEALLERERRGQHVRGPAVGLIAVLLTVAVSGELYLTLYLVGTVALLAVLALLAALIRRRSLPLRTIGAAAASIVLAAGYTLAVFHLVFGSGVNGPQGNYTEIQRYAPSSIAALVVPRLGAFDEGLIYLGWPLLLLALAGGVVAIARRRALLTYVVLGLVTVYMAYASTADTQLARIGLGGLRPYRLVFEHLPLFHLQRVPERIMAVGSMVLLVLAVAGADALWAGIATRGRRLPAATAVGVVLVLLVGAVVVQEFRILPTGRLMPAQHDNSVVSALRAGDADRPFVGVPIVNKTEPWNSATTYLAALSGRKTINAYTNTAAPLLDARILALSSLNRGVVTPAAAAVLRRTGTDEIVVVDETEVFPSAAAWQAVVDRLVASGRFHLVTQDGPFALLRRNG